MLSNILKVGQVVESTSGRDRGLKFFVIKIVDRDFVLISDGKKRKLDQPKLKKVKHLKRYNVVNNEVKDKIESRENLTDAFLRAQLTKLNQEV